MKFKFIEMAGDAIPTFKKNILQWVKSFSGKLLSSEKQAGVKRYWFKSPVQGNEKNQKLIIRKKPKDIELAELESGYFVCHYKGINFDIFVQSGEENDEDFDTILLSIYDRNEIGKYALHGIDDADRY